jgi:hypothetical protein
MPNSKDYASQTKGYWQPWSDVNFLVRVCPEVSRSVRRRNIETTKASRKPAPKRRGRDIFDITSGLLSLHQKVSLLRSSLPGGSGANDRSWKNSSLEHIPEFLSEMDKEPEKWKSDQIGNPNRDLLA